MQKQTVQQAEKYFEEHADENNLINQFSNTKNLIVSKDEITADNLPTYIFKKGP